MSRASVSVAAALLSLGLGCGKMWGCVDCDYWSATPDAGERPRYEGIYEPPCELGAVHCSGVEVQRCEAAGWKKLQVCAAPELCNYELGTCLDPDVDAGELPADAGADPELRDAGADSGAAPRDAAVAG